MKTSARLFLSFMLLAVALGSAEASAQSCTTYLQGKFSWVSQGSGHYLEVKGTSINASTGYSGLVSYVTGYVDQYSAPYWAYLAGTWVYLPAQVSSHANRQLFDDRRNGSQPFNYTAYDQLGITLDAAGKITITFDTWGGGAVTVTPTTCTSNIISGFSSDGTMWAFAFYERWLG